MVRVGARPLQAPFGAQGMIRLQSGALAIYGSKDENYCAAFSSDEGKTWSEPMIVSGDGAGGDLGYPSTVQLEDGSLVTVWYEKLAGSTLAVLRQATWRI